jgi:hypothetical protein
VSGIALWYDPGKLTGVCGVDPDTGQLLYIDEHDLMNTGQTLEYGIQTFHGPKPMIDSVTSPVKVGWETYRIMKGAQTQAPWSLEAIGMIKYMCLRNGYTILPPADPSQRNVCTLTMLKAMGWYPRIKGRKDALSAAQHCVAWWLRTDTLPEQYHDAVYGPLHN